jgi:hypothetical protein
LILVATRRRRVVHEDEFVALASEYGYRSIPEYGIDIAEAAAAIVRGPITYPLRVGRGHRTFVAGGVFLGDDPYCVAESCGPAGRGSRSRRPPARGSG